MHMDIAAVVVSDVYKRQDQHHAKGRRAAADMALEQKEKRYADERAAAKAQNLPFC